MRNGVRVLSDPFAIARRALGGMVAWGPLRAYRGRLIGYRAVEKALSQLVEWPGLRMLELGIGNPVAYAALVPEVEDVEPVEIEYDYKKRLSVAGIFADYFPGAAIVYTMSVVNECGTHSGARRAAPGCAYGGRGSPNRYCGWKLYNACDKYSVFAMTDDGVWQLIKVDNALNKGMFVGVIDCQTSCDEGAPCVYPQIRVVGTNGRMGYARVCSAEAVGGKYPIRISALLYSSDMQNGTTCTCGYNPFTRHVDVDVPEPGGGEEDAWVIWP